MIEFEDGPSGDQDALHELARVLGLLCDYYRCGAPAACKVYVVQFKRTNQYCMEHGHAHDWAARKKGYETRMTRIEVPSGNERRSGEDDRSEAAARGTDVDAGAEGGPAPEDAGVLGDARVAP